MKIRRNNIMPLVSAPYKPGTALGFIETIEDYDEKQMALADYYQYTGKAKNAVDIAKRYLNSEDMTLSIPAHMICFISGLAIGDAALARNTLHSLERIESKLDYHSSGKYCTNMLRIVLYLKDDEVQLPFAIPEELPNGVRYFACFFFALNEYLNERFEYAVGMASSALTLGAGNYPIPKIYLHLISAAALIRIKDYKEAERQYELAVETAKPDGLYAPFAQMYVLLAGLNAKRIKKVDAELYQKISKYANTWIMTWVNAHDGLADWLPKDGLTKTEHIVALLFGKGFSAKEIARLMELSANTVKTHIARIYRKTAVQNREDLSKVVIR